LLGRAAAREHDAARRYRSIAQLALARDEKEAAEVAETLALEAEDRARAILGRAPASGGFAMSGKESATVPSPGMAEHWHDLATSGRLTPYRLFAHGVARIADAFAGYAYGASGARSEDVRTAGEQLGREELDRAARMRRERRRAFHRDGRPVSLASLEPHEIHREVLARFTALARLFQGFAARCRELGDETRAELLLSLLPRRLAPEAPPAKLEAGSAADILRRALGALQATAETLENLAANTLDESVLSSAIRGLEDIVTAIARVTQRLATAGASERQAPSPERAKGEPVPSARSGRSSPTASNIGISGSVTPDRSDA
jgi:hypothetical protein